MIDASVSEANRRPKVGIDHETSATLGAGAEGGLDHETSATLGAGAEGGLDHAAPKYNGELPTEAVLAITPGRYTHYKNLPYRVIGTARHSETMELLVVYEALYQKEGISADEQKLGSLWVRPAKMFAESVTAHGQTVPRFKRIGD